MCQMRRATSSLHVPPRSGRSLQEYLHAELMELARRPDPETLLKAARDRKRRTGSQLSADAILSHRDADRR